MKGKQVLLTGGTGGLGLGVTPAVLATGARVVIPYLRDTGIPRLKERLGAALFEQIRFVKVDLNQEAQVERLVDSLGGIGVLIHLVGGFTMGKTSEFSYAEWLKSLDLNLNTTFLVCKHCLRVMQQQGYGRIVTVASGAALEPGGQLAAYAAAKAGVIALTKSIAQETKGTNITANVVLPSVIDTPTNREAMGDEAASRWVKPESLAKVICFLASVEARDVRGAVIPVYGDA